MAFIAYSVRDVPRAKKFYQETLGLTPGQAFGDHWIEFEVGNCTFGIGNGEPLGYVPGQSTGAVFEVDDINAMRERLAAAGSQVSEVNESPVCFSVFTNDPEGNRFAVHQRKAE